MLAFLYFFFGKDHQKATHLARIDYKYRLIQKLLAGVIAGFAATYLLAQVLPIIFAPPANQWPRTPLPETHQTMSLILFFGMFSAAFGGYRLLDKMIVKVG